MKYWMQAVYEEKVCLAHRVGGSWTWGLCGSTLVRTLWWMRMAEQEHVSGQEAELAGAGLLL